MDFWWYVRLLEVALISPIVQEIFFRGAIFAYARQAGGLAFGLIFSSLVFAGSHLNASEQFSSTLVIGIIFATQYEVTKRLNAPILTHCIVNFLATLTRLQYF